MRGDVAVLDTDQAADATHWYIYRWDDLSAPLAGRAVDLARINARVGTTGGGVPATPVTFGAFKDSFRH